MPTVFETGVAPETVLPVAVEIAPARAPAPVPGKASWAVLQSTVGAVATLLLNASTGILTARALLPAGRGEMAAMILWPLFLAYISSLGMPSALIYFLRNRADQRAELIPTGLLGSVLLGCIAAVAGAFFLPFWLHNYSPAIIHASQFFLLATPLCAVNQSGRAVLEASGSFIASNSVLVAQPAATLAMLLVLLATHRLTPISAASVYIGATLASLVIVLTRVHRVVPMRWRIRVDAMRLLLGYGIRSYGVDILGAFALQVDQVLVIRLLNPAAMGVYGVALSLSRMFNVFQGAVVTVLFPRASGRTHAEIRTMTEFSTRITTMLTAMFALVASLVGPFLLRTLYGREYGGASVTLDLLLVEVTLSGAVFIMAQAYMAMGRPGMVTIVQSMGLSLSIPLMLLLIPYWGINGAAVALLTSTVARFLLVYFGFGFILHVPRLQLLPQLSDFKIVAARLRRSPAADPEHEGAR
jgi:O-antigen/teichoic acid export membrane protein